MDHRRKVIAGNWKMNTTLDEAVELINEMRYEIEEIVNVETIICPPFISLYKLKELICDTHIKLGAQNVYFEEQGAFTGEISPLMLSELCQYVLIGHSERRQYFQESDKTINYKIKAALRHGIKPIICIGENLSQKEAGATRNIIHTQLTQDLAEIDAPNVLIAYEPIWAIGSGKAADAKNVNSLMSEIRHLLAEIYNQETANQIPLLYGGSVNASNISAFLQQSEIDGALVGGASLKPTQFVEIIRQASLIS